MSTTTDSTAFNRQIIEEFRAHGGKVGGQFAGAPMVLLTTTGARSGQPRVAPLVYTINGDRVVIIASKGGAPTNPDWYHNLKANPYVKVELPEDTYQATDVDHLGEERDRLYGAMAARMPNFAEYQRNTSRRIPVVVLERVAEDTG